MSLVESARRIESDPPMSEDFWCAYCHNRTKSGEGPGWLPPDEHLADCPIRAMPKIVSVLMTVESLATSMRSDSDEHGDELTDLLLILIALYEGLPAPVKS